MVTSRLTRVVNELIDDAKTAVLATVDEKGIPRVRWITPAQLDGYPSTLFIVSAHNFSKVVQARKNPKATIMIQTRILDKVLNCEGKLMVVENPSIRSELLEKIGSRLHAFWKAGSAERDLVALEFTISRAILYLPLKGSREVLEGEEGK